MVDLFSRNPEVVDVAVNSVLIPAGSREAEIPLVVTATGNSQALIELIVGDQLKTLQVVVGLPPSGEEPRVFAPTVGIVIE